MLYQNFSEVNLGLKFKLSLCEEFDYMKPQQLSVVPSLVRQRPLIDTLEF